VGKSFIETTDKGWPFGLLVAGDFWDGGIDLWMVDDDLNIFIIFKRGFSAPGR
jgi:hypothetical protein